jgi:hypothetical protein
MNNRFDTTIGETRRAELLAAATTARRGQGFELAAPAPAVRVTGVALLLVAALASLAFVTAPVTGGVTVDPVTGGGAGRALAR